MRFRKMRVLKRARGGFRQSATMGFHGQWEHPEVVRAMESVIEIALAKGVATEPAIYPSTREEYERLRERGLQFFGRFRHSEYDMLREVATQALSIYR